MTEAPITAAVTETEDPILTLSNGVKIPRRTEMLVPAGELPQFNHDIIGCHFLGRYNQPDLKVDLYYRLPAAFNRGPEIQVRYGNNPRENQRVIEEAYNVYRILHQYPDQARNYAAHDKAQAEGYRRALAHGLPKLRSVPAPGKPANMAPLPPNSPEGTLQPAARYIHSCSACMFLGTVENAQAGLLDLYYCSDMPGGTPQFKARYGNDVTRVMQVDISRLPAIVQTYVDGYLVDLRYAESFIEAYKRAATFKLPGCGPMPAPTPPYVPTAAELKQFGAVANMLAHGGNYATIAGTFMVNTSVKRLDMAVRNKYWQSTDDLKIKGIWEALGWSVRFLNRRSS